MLKLDHAKEPDAYKAARVFVNPENKTAQLVFMSKNGCRHQAEGHGCAMCSYGHGSRDVMPDDVDEMFGILKQQIFDQENYGLLLGANGSILDESEFSADCLDTLLVNIAQTGFKQVFFETHCDTINDTVLDKIERAIPDTPVFIELGLETADEQKRAKNLNKPFTNQQYLNAFRMIKEHGFNFVTNLLVGLPYADTAEQIDDAVGSVHFAIQNGADHAVLFPYNAKPDTKTWNDNVPQINAWMPIEVLRRLGSDNIEQGTRDPIPNVYFAWYGNKKVKINGAESIPPKTCENCSDRLADFYVKFQGEDDPLRRRMLVDQLIAERGCGCYDELLGQVQAR